MKRDKYTFVCRLTEVAEDEEEARMLIGEQISTGIKYDEIHDWFELESTEPYDTDDDEL